MKNTVGSLLSSIGLGRGTATSSAAGRSLEPSPTVAPKPAPTVPLADRAAALMAALPTDAPLDQRLQAVQQAVDVLRDEYEASPARLASELSGSTLSRNTKEQVLKLGLQACVSTAACAGSPAVNLALQMMKCEPDVTERGKMGSSAVSLLSTAGPVSCFNRVATNVPAEKRAAAAEAILQAVIATTTPAPLALAARLLCHVTGDPGAESQLAAALKEAGCLELPRLPASTSSSRSTDLAAEILHLTVALSFVPASSRGEDHASNKEALLRLPELVRRADASGQCVLARHLDVVLDAIHLNPDRERKMAVEALSLLGSPVDSSGVAMTGLLLAALQRRDRTSNATNDTEKDVCVRLLRHAAAATTDSRYANAFGMMAEAVDPRHGLHSNHGDVHVVMALRKLQKSAAATCGSEDPVQVAAQALLSGVSGPLQADMIMAAADEHATSPQFRAQVQQWRECLVQDGILGMRRAVTGAPCS